VETLFYARKQKSFFYAQNLTSNDDGAHQHLNESVLKIIQSNVFVARGSCDVIPPETPTPPSHFSLVVFEALIFGLHEILSQPANN
jgi:hypothetical protein